MLANAMLTRYSRQATEDEMKQNLAVYPMPCLIWTGTVVNGRGRISLNGRSRSAPAFSWGLANCETIQSPLVARHLCKNILCVEVTHIQPGTKKENAADRERDGTSNIGSKNPSASISEFTAVAIATSHWKGKTQAERAKQFNTTISVVSNIDSGVSWKHVVVTTAKSQSNSKRLTNDHVRKIRISVAEGKTRAETAKTACVSKAVVSNIINRRGYASVPDDEKLDYKIEEQKELQYVENVKKRLLQGSEMNENGCQIWKKCSHGGYAQSSFRGTSRYVHVISWIIYHGRGIDSIGEFQVRHGCGESRCVNPQHLSLGTALENAQDKVLNGTILLGSDCARAVINEEIALEIKRSQRKKESVSSVAQRFKISHGIVRNVYTGTTWKHVLLPDDDDLPNPTVVPGTTSDKVASESKVEAVFPEDVPSATITTKTTLTRKRKRISVAIPKRHVMSTSEQELKQVAVPDYLGAV